MNELPGALGVADSVDASSAANRPSSSDLYDAIATQIERETVLINHRLTWTLQLNGFLFATLGFLGGRDLTDVALLTLVHTLIPITGFFVSLAGALGVCAAQSQISYLTKRWEAWLTEDARPRPFGSKRGSYLIGILPCLLPPAVLMLVWATLCIIRSVHL